MLRLKNSFFIILLGSLVFLSCYPQDVEPPFIGFDTESFNREWTAWEAQGITGYAVEEDVLIAGRRREIAHIVVRDNVIIQHETLDRWDDINEEDHLYHLYYTRGLLNEVRTISEIYAWVNRVYEEAVALYTDSNGRYGIQIKITYNSRGFHYPQVVRISSMGDWGGALNCDLRLSKFQ